MPRSARDVWLWMTLCAGHGCLLRVWTLFPDLEMCYGNPFQMRPAMARVEKESLLRSMVLHVLQPRSSRYRPVFCSRMAPIGWSDACIPTSAGLALCCSAWTHGHHCPFPLASNLVQRGGWCHQFRALFWKRFLTARRDRLATLFQVIVPVVLVALALWSSYATRDALQQPPLELVPAAALGRKPIAVGISSAAASNESLQVAELMKSFVGVELRDTGARNILRHPYAEPLNGTLDQELLDHWCDVLDGP